MQTKLSHRILVLLLISNGLVMAIAIILPQALPQLTGIPERLGLSASIFLAGILLTWLIAALLSRMVKRRILRFTEALEQARTGDLGVVFNVDFDDEFRDLATGLRELNRERIREKRIAESQMADLAFHDPLTGLFNRRSYHEKLLDAILYAQRYESERQKGVLMMDLDHFKDVNETMGHEVGDNILRRVSEILQASVRESDHVFRIGGDEFAVLLTHLSLETDAAIVAEKLLRELAEPIIIDGRSVYISASLGIAIYPKDGEDVDTLVRNAENALFQAKQDRGSYRFFASDMHQKALEKIETKNLLHLALTRGEFLVYYQPLVGIDGKVMGAEALVRWRPPGHDIIPPDLFIPVAEETGLIVPIGKWVMEQAFRDCKAWNESGISPLFVAVNLSVRQFKDAELENDIRHAMEQTGINPEYVHLEITESSLMENLDEKSLRLRTLKDQGFRFSIDDFGTGYSSLSYLTRLPLHTLKIDKSFIRNILSEKAEDGWVVKTIISMAHQLNLEVVAEGVETVEQLQTLRELKCDLIQGYYYSKPLPNEQFVEFVKNFASRA
jgi:diguanylate cyclase (GGDEF)-like protein